MGRGGMGAVYLAHEEALDRQVAIKVLPPEASDGNARERFKREARTAAKLNHPNIVSLYTFGIVEDTMYFVMEYVDGESLEDHLKRAGQIEETRAREILIDVAGALGYAHEQGVLHRDIKPDNILLASDTGKPMLTDFGIAKLSVEGQTLTEVGSVLGTVHYMSPEQASGEPLDGRSDLYALGIVGYRMLTGKMPFGGQTFHEVLAQQVTVAPVPVDAVVPGVSGELSESIMRCLAKTPGERWADARGFAQAITIKGYWEERLPAALEHTTFFTRVAMGATALGVVGFVSQVGDWMMGQGFPVTNWALLGTATVGTLGMVQLRQEGERAGFDKRTVLRAMFRPPLSWPWRLPRWLRPRDDVWDRLPDDVIKVRDREFTAVTIAVGSFLVMELLLGAATGMLHSLPAGSVFGWLPVLIVLGWLGLGGPGLLLWVLSPMTNLKKRLRKLGLDTQAVKSVIHGRTFGNEFWDQPEIAALLKPGHSGTGSAAPDAERPAELVAAVRKAARSLPAASDAFGSEIVTVAEQVERAISALDGELKVLAQNTRADEIAQIKQRLAALGNAPEQDGARELVHGQLELAKRMRRRLEDVSNRRARLKDLLKNLWVHVAALQAEGARVNTGDGEVSEKVRALCEDIQRQMSARDEATSVLVNDLPS